MAHPIPASPRRVAPEIVLDGAIEAGVLEEKRARSPRADVAGTVQSEGLAHSAVQKPSPALCTAHPAALETTPTVNARPTEINHVFRGPWPTEWLIVSFMDKASTNRMTDWVDAVMARVGFPVMDMIAESDASPLSESWASTQPRTLEWDYEGAFESVADRMRLDEVHCYSGIGRLPGHTPQLARLYILLARRKTFAWKITLSFETGV